MFFPDILVRMNYNFLSIARKWDLHAVVSFEISVVLGGTQSSALAGVQKIWSPVHACAQTHGMT